MSAPIRFYFDFVSTYSYFAVCRIDAVAAKHGREVDWRLVSLPHVFKANAAVSPLDQPRKLAHNREDVIRVAAMLGLKFTEPKVRPLDAALPRLAFYRLRRRDPALAQRFAVAVMSRYFGEGEEVRSVDQVLRATTGLPITRDELEASLADQEARRELVGMLDAALADGMFGAPYAVVEDQHFWGHDRVTDHLDWWLHRSC